MVRQFVQPVFSPSSSNGDSSSSSFAGRQQQQPQQQAAQQDLAQQRAPRFSTDDNVSFTRRSVVGETFSPAPAPGFPAGGGSVGGGAPHHFGGPSPGHR